MAGPALWNATTRYAGNPSGDWIKYFAHIVAALGAGECDGMALHTYTHEHDPGKIKADIPHPSPGYHHLRDQFRSYRDLIEAIPTRFRGLPVYITETDPTERHRGWGRRQEQSLGAHSLRGDRRVERKTRVASPSSRSCSIAGSRPPISRNGPSSRDRPGVQDDFRQAMRSEPAAAYRVRLPAPRRPPPPSRRSLRPRLRRNPSNRSPMLDRTRGSSNQALIDAFYSAGVMLVPARPWGR